MLRLRAWSWAVVVSFVACSTPDTPPEPDDAVRGEAAPEPEDAPVEPLPTTDTPPPDAGADASDGGGATSDAGASCAITLVPKAAYLTYGLHPRASDALVYLKVTAGRVTQTIGAATASAGTHKQDGTAEGHAYSAATDLSVRGMSEDQVAAFLDQLTSVGFAAYYRRPGFDGWPASEARHIHAIWVGAPMKASLQSQVRDWHVGKNGLASHTTYTFKTWPKCWRDALWARYLTANPP